jgi:LacI family transcriptional regulator
VPRQSARRRNGIREVAAAAGVSIGTVSNVLNCPEVVATSTRERVERAMRELEFVPNGVARQLRDGRGRTAGAIVLDLANPFFTEVARGIQDRLAQADVTLTVCSTDGAPDREDRYLQVLEEQGVRGILITPTRMRPGTLLDIQRRGVPVVLLDCPSPTPDLCSVAVDDTLGGELVITHLLDRGHRRIAFVNGPTRVPQCAARSAGVRRGLRAAGLDPAEHLTEVELPSATAVAGEQAVPEVLAGPHPPTAIICVSDWVALGVLRALGRRGVAVPGEVAVVGYDDVPYAAELYAPLTSVWQPKYELGRAAAELLLSKAEAGHRCTQVTFEPALIVRESSAAAIA